MIQYTITYGPQVLCPGSNTIPSGVNLGYVYCPYCHKAVSVWSGGMVSHYDGAPGITPYRRPAMPCPISHSEALTLAREHVALEPPPGAYDAGTLDGLLAAQKVARAYIDLRERAAAWLRFSPSRPEPLVARRAYEALREAAKEERERDG